MLYDDKLSDGAKVTWAHLARIADYDTGEVSGYTVADIAEARGKASGATVRAHVAELAERGHLTTQRGATTTYWLAHHDHDRQISGTPSTDDRQISGAQPPDNWHNDRQISGTAPSIQRTPEHRDASAFGAFLSAYPRKINRGKARQAFDARVREGIEPSVLTEGATRYARWVTENGVDLEHVRSPHTWLEAEGWADELKPLGKPTLWGNATW